MKALITDKYRYLEILAVVLTALGKFIFMDWLQWKLPFIVAAIIGWATYVIVRQKQLPGILRYWGFRTDNFRDVLKMVLPFGVISTLVFVTLGFYLRTINFTWHIFPILLLYPVWGTIQQFLVMGIVAGNLKDMAGSRLSHPVIIFTTALLFGFLHYPFYWLIAGTFALALFYGYIYLKARNVYVMGVFHGWIGALFFYTVVDRDPFLEVFGKIL